MNNRIVIQHGKAV